MVSAEKVPPPAVTLTVCPARSVTESSGDLRRSGVAVTWNRSLRWKAAARRMPAADGDHLKGSAGGGGAPACLLLPPPAAICVLQAARGCLMAH